MAFTRFEVGAKNRGVLRQTALTGKAEYHARILGIIGAFVRKRNNGSRKFGRDE